MSLPYAGQTSGTGLVRVQLVAVPYCRPCRASKACHETSAEISVDVAVRVWPISVNRADECDSEAGFGFAEPIIWISRGTGMLSISGTVVKYFEPLLLMAWRRAMMMV